MNGILLGSCALLTTMATISTSNAQTATPSQDSDTIIVTAQKRDERLLDVPVATTAVSADTLVSQNITSLSAFYNRVPGLQYAGERTSQISIRGVTSGGQSNPTVALLVDDIPFGSSTYLGNATVPNFDPAVLQRIEVLRGPQGTLYGAASLGGLLKYVTKNPDTKTFSGRMEVGASKVEDGGYGHSIRGAVNVPILADHVALSVSGFLNETPAWVDDLSTGSLRQDTNTSKSWGGRAALLVKPFDGLTLNFSAMKQRSDTVGGAQYNVRSATDLTPVNTNRVAGPIGAALPYRTTATGLAEGRRNYELYSARGDWDLGFGTLSSVSGWSRSDVSDLSDVTPVFGFLLPFYANSRAASVDNASSLRKFSQEVRLAGASPMFDWLVGGFYTKEHADAPQSIRVLANGGGSIATAYTGANPSSYREIAGFADLTWHATDKLDIQVGGRYADNKQTYASVTTVDSAVVPVFGPSTIDSTGSKDHAFTWLVTPSYKIARDLMVFARVATGYRPGGPNTVVPNVPRSFGSDRVTSYEFGLKGQTVNRLLSYDLALFQIDWKDIQLQSTDVATQFAFFINGPKARSRGAEAQLGLKPFAGLSVDANASYTDATLRNDLPPSSLTTSNLIGSKGDRLPSTAKFAGSLSAQYDFAVSNDLDAFVGGTLVYLGKRPGGFINIPGAVRTEAPEYTTLDLRAGFSIDKRWEFSLFARNLFDKDGVLTLDNRNGSLGRPQVNFIQPRTVGFNIAGSF
jgi:outer membrane receptor protein involved in Fe transport